MKYQNWGTCLRTRSLKDCKSQKSGKNYNATLLLSTEENGRANFHLEFENSRSGTKGGGEK